MSKNLFCRVFFSIAALILLFVSSIIGQVPSKCNFQGRLMDTSSNPVSDGSYSVVFSIYDSDVGGSLIWQESKTITTENGFYSTELGSVVSFDDSDFNGAVRYLGIKIETDPEMTPRIALLSVPFSFHSSVSDSANTVKDGSITLFDIGQNGATPGEIIKWNGSSWEMSIDNNESYLAGDGLTLTGPTFSISDGGITSLMIVDGTITTSDLAQNGASSGQILKWNGSAWTVANDETGSGGGSSWNWTDSSSHGPDSVLYADTSAYSMSSVTATKSDSTDAITDGGIDLADIGQNGASSGQILKWNGSTWTVANDETGAGGGGSSWNWSDSSSYGPDSVKFASNFRMPAVVSADTSGAAMEIRNFGSGPGIYGVNTSSSNTKNIGTEGYANNATSENIGVMGGAFGTSGSVYGVKGNARGPGVNYGVYGEANFYTTINTNYGLYGTATSGQINYGIYATASGGTTNWAGYFQGDVNITGGLTLTDGALSNGSILFEDIDQNSATSGQVMKWNGSTWAAADVGAGSSWNWSDSSSHGPDSVLYADTSAYASNSNSASTATTSDSTNAITDGGVDFADIGQNGAATNQVIKWNGTNWAAANDEQGANIWQRNGKHVALINFQDSVGIGTTGPGAKLSVVGDFFADLNARIGRGNSISGSDNIVVGYQNTVNSDFASIVGGTLNEVTGLQSILAGGYDNTLNGENSFIGAGKYNILTGDQSIIGSGEYNQIDERKSFIGTGFENRIFTNAYSSGIVSGENNQIYHLMSFIGGGAVNRIFEMKSAIAGGSSNMIYSDYGFIGGGYGNHIDTVSYAVSTKSAIAGGERNTITINNAFIGGGRFNSVSGIYGTICGGDSNTVTSKYGVIAGGRGNLASTDYATVGGGYKNVSYGWFSVIPGGYMCRVDDDYSFAAGTRAKAISRGTFVWADNTDADFYSDAVNQFTVRASGGYKLYSSADLSTGVTLASGGGSWASVSDRNVKANIQPVNGDEILDKISELEISRWNYQTQDESIQHIGPMAQDFYELFKVGDNNTTITTIDPDGISLAAIKALIEKNKNLENEVEELKELVKQLIESKN